MGAWGYKALESDEGLDVVDFMSEYISKKPEQQIELTLSELVASMKVDGFFGKNFDEIEFFYDHSAMALAELYFNFQDNGELEYDNEYEHRNLRKRIKSFTADKISLEFLRQYLVDIRDEKPEKYGGREIVELWRESKDWDNWKANLMFLIERLEKEIKK